MGEDCGRSKFENEEFVTNSKSKVSSYLETNSTIQLHRPSKMMRITESTERQGYHTSDDTKDSATSIRPSEYDPVEEIRNGNQINWEGIICEGFASHDGKSVVSKFIAELTKSDTANSVYKLMRLGISKFYIDMHYGSIGENKHVLDVISQAQKFMFISHDVMIPVSIIPLISRRYPETGLVGGAESVKVVPGEQIVLTTDRQYAKAGGKEKLFVNCRHILGSLKVQDKIFIDEIVLEVQETLNFSIKCIILTGGNLLPKMPVRFEGHSAINSLSHEELEDITFLIESRINVLVVSKPQDLHFYQTIKQALDEFGGRFVKIICICSEDIIEDKQKLFWIADTYSGVIFKYDNLTNASEMARQIRCLLKRCYTKMKAIVVCVSSRICHPESLETNFLRTIQKCALFYPDSYLLNISCRNIVSENSFQSVRRYVDLMTFPELTRPRRESFKSESDRMARDVTIASYQNSVSVIIVCSTKMAIKVSHFRPKCPILVVTKNQKLTHFLQVLHNIFLIDYTAEGKDVSSRNERLQDALTQAVVHGVGRNVIKLGDSAIFCYKSKHNLKYTVFNVILKELKKFLL